MLPIKPLLNALQEWVIVLPPQTLLNSGLLTLMFQTIEPILTGFPTVLFPSFFFEFFEIFFFYNFFLIVGIGC